MDPPAPPAIRTAVILSLLALAVAVPADRSFAGTGPPPAADRSTDPLSPEAGDFLDADTGALRGRAEAAYAAGDMKGAAGAYLELLKHDHFDAAALYNLACCYGRMGDAARAARFLLKAVEAGFEDMGRVRKDPDFSAVRRAAPFALAVDAIAVRLREREEQWGETLFVDAPAPVACRVRTPERSEGAKPPTLLVALHGFASRPETLTPLWNALEKPAFIFAAPRGPFALPGRARPVFSWRAPLPDDTREDNLRALEMADRYITALVRDLKRRYGAGEVYLMGFSQGAFYAYGSGLRHPDLLTGLLCFGGRFPQDLLDGAALKAASSMRVLIAHGVKDAAVNPAEGERALEVLGKHGYDATMVRFDGGHEVPDAVFRQAAEWMLLPPSARAAHGIPAADGLQ